jgi:hypothetical protein
VNVRMVNSVGALVAGEEYELDDAEGDRLVLLGYATGRLSRVYDEDEVDRVRAEANAQEVRFDG